MYPQRSDGYYEMEAGLLFRRGGFIYFIRVGFSCLHSSASPARWGCTPAIYFFSFSFVGGRKKLPSDQLFWVVDNRYCCSLVCEKSATHLPSCAEKGLLEAFSVCESQLRHKAKSWRSMYISWPASRSPFSLKTSGLTHAQNQPPFVQPLQTPFLSC